MAAPVSNPCTHGRSTRKHASGVNCSRDSNTRRNRASPPRFPSRALGIRRPLRPHLPLDLALRRRHRQHRRVACCEV